MLSVIFDFLFLPKDSRCSSAIENVKKKKNYSYKIREILYFCCFIEFCVSKIRPLLLFGIQFFASPFICVYWWNNIKMSPLNTNHTVYEGDVPSNESINIDSVPPKIIYGMQELLQLRDNVQQQPPRAVETPQMRMVAKINLMPTFAASCMPLRPDSFGPIPSTSSSSRSSSMSSMSSPSSSSSIDGRNNFHGRRYQHGGGGNIGHDHNTNANKSSRGMYINE